METKTEEFKRVKLFTEHTLLKAVLQARENLHKVIENFSDHLSREGITLDSEILSLFLQNGYSVIQRLLIERAKQNLEKLKIKGSLLSQNLESEALDLAREFEKYIQPISNALQKAHIGYNQVTFQKGRPVLTEQEKAEIEELHTVYLETHEDKQLYEALEKFVQAYDQAYEFLSERDIDLSSDLIAALTENNMVQTDYFPGPGSTELRRDICLIDDASGEDSKRIRINPKFFTK